MEVKRCTVGGNKKKKSLPVRPGSLLSDYDVIERRQTFKTEWPDSKRRQKCRAAQGCHYPRQVLWLGFVKPILGLVIGSVSRAFV